MARPENSAAMQTTSHDDEPCVVTAASTYTKLDYPYQSQENNISVQTLMTKANFELISCTGQPTECNSNKVLPHLSPPPPPPQPQGSFPSLISSDLLGDIRRCESVRGRQRNASQRPGPGPNPCPTKSSVTNPNNAKSPDQAKADIPVHDPNGVDTPAADQNSPDDDNEPPDPPINPNREGQLTDSSNGCPHHPIAEYLLDEDDFDPTKLQLLGD